MELLEYLKSELRKSYSENLNNFFDYSYKCNYFYNPVNDLKDLINVVYCTAFQTLYESLSDGNTIYVFTTFDECVKVKKEIINYIQLLITKCENLNWKRDFKLFTKNYDISENLSDVNLQCGDRNVYIKVTYSDQVYLYGNSIHKKNPSDLIFTSSFNDSDFLRDLNIRSQDKIIILGVLDNVDFGNIKDVNYIKPIHSVMKESLNVSNDSILLEQYKAIGSIENIITLVSEFKDLLKRNVNLIKIVEEQRELIKSQQEDLFKFQKELDIKSVDELKLIVSTYKKLYSILYPNIESDIKENKVSDYIVDPERLQFLNE